jgi:hypothetical protein
MCNSCQHIGLLIFRMKLKISLFFYESAFYLFFNLVLKIIVNFENLISILSQFCRNHLQFYEIKSLHFFLLNIKNEFIQNI